ncbi:MAG: rhodanese-related sulfurtransferase [Ardenticatenaceae bacterium]|nr:rhodanese-related sulfurtransferase [Anaerolineales bacterium]MCB8940236.1 rhodanese-related sulfurtransferase [Ardenticatenaceae bacterium]MCB8973251.1 rhodanese-related sulfurtransferase [Ardenticatenaceae bacterium]
MSSFVIAAFYKFVDLPEYAERQRPLLNFCTAQDVKGSILLAAEGINGTIAGSRQGIDAVLTHLRQDVAFANLTHKESHADFMPFSRMKVRLKREIVNLGRPDITPNKRVGQYIPADEWNALISRPDVILVDTRNDFEVEIGTFKGAINPKVDAFNQFPDFVEQNLDPSRHKKVAMFCTGGIRCEKATAYMLEQGFEEVYHLKDGILKYLEQVSPEESMWQGNCFVFDDRVSVDHHLDPAQIELCPMCKTAIEPQHRSSPQYEFGVRCPVCADKLTYEQIERAREKQRQLELAAERDAAM